MSEKHINIEQLSLQRNEAVEQDKEIMQVVEEPCRMVLELEIQAEEPVEVRIRKLAIVVCDARVEITRVQLELNLQITKL